MGGALNMTNGWVAQVLKYEEEVMQLRAGVEKVVHEVAMGQHSSSATRRALLQHLPDFMAFLGRKYNPRHIVFMVSSSAFFLSFLISFFPFYLRGWGLASCPSDFLLSFTLRKGDRPDTS